MLVNGISFKEAERLINSREPKETALSHAKIMKTWTQDMRNRAFFSARCTNAAVLSQLKTLAERVTAGAMTQKQAVRLAREVFAKEANALAAMGFAPKEGAQGITELASIPRLNLIFYTQLKMAQEKGHFEQWEQVADKFPYGIWRCGYSKEHRPEHLARNGKVYAFEHPIWRQSPPGGEFNCHCFREVITEAQLQQMGLTPEPMGVFFSPSSLGFNPSLPYDDKNGINIGGNIPPELIPPAEPVQPVAPVAQVPPPAPEPVIPEPEPQQPPQPQAPIRRAEGSITPEQTAQDALRFGLSQIQNAHTAEQDANMANPQYANGRDYRNNCQRCVVTFEARRRGFDVEALPSLRCNDRLPYSFANDGWTSIFANTTPNDFIWCNGNSARRVRSNIENRMREFGEGARAVLRMTWRNGGGGGHVINIEVINGNVVFIDAQNPNYDIDTIFEHFICNSRNPRRNPCILRVDNRQFSARLLECCKNRS